MNYDLALIASVLESGDIGTPLKAGIKSKMLSEEAQVYWDMLTDHYEHFNQVLSADFFTGIMANYDHHPIPDCIDAIIHEVKTRYLFGEMQDALKKLADTCNQSPWIAKDEMLKFAETLNMELQLSNNDLIAGEDKAQILKTIEMLQHSGGLLGMPWPWTYVNDNTFGLMPGNFVYLYGREKSRKTWLLLFLALYWESLGHKILFISREMSLPEIAWRLYPLRAKIDYKELTRGNISTDGKITLEQAMDDLYRNKNIIISEVGGGIAGLRAKIEEVKPDIVIHDYLKGLAEDEMGDRMNAKQDQYVARIADKAKEMAKRYNVPFIGCGHANREGIKMKGQNTSEIGHSDHIARRADLVIRVIIDDIRDRMALIVPAGRNVQKFLNWTIDASLGPKFGDFESPDTSWVEDIEEVDAAARKSQRANKKEVVDVAAGIAKVGGKKEEEPPKKTRAKKQVVRH